MPYSDIIPKAAVLVEALPYIQAFRDAVVVVKFGGSAMEDKACAESALRDIVFMECVGMKPVIVHGGGKAISGRLAELGIGTTFINGLRYTCEETIKVVDSVLHDEVNPALVQAIEQHGGRAQPVSGKNVLEARRAVGDDEDGNDVDLGFVGEVAGVDIAHIRKLIDDGIVPVVTPVGSGANDQAYNINADVAACKVAEALQARKLVFLSDVPGILKDPTDETTRISTIQLSEIDELTRRRIISGGMVPKIRSAVSALRAGTNKVHLIDGRVQHSLLLEIFTDAGVGTQIIKD
jgi:acetylglutamate kinase